MLQDDVPQLVPQDERQAVGVPLHHSMEQPGVHDDLGADLVVLGGVVGKGLDLVVVAGLWEGRGPGDAGDGLRHGQQAALDLVDQIAIGLGDLGPRRGGHRRPG